MLVFTKIKATADFMQVKAYLSGQSYHYKDTNLLHVQIFSLLYGNSLEQYN